MKQLSPMDSAFLALETATMTGNISSLLILDPSDVEGEFDLGRLMSFVATRIERVPVFRQRMATVPLGLDRPYWVDDERFDLSYHVRESALPSPGDMSQLLELVGRLQERPLDMSRPLWETYLITGLPDDRVAIFTKTHHVVIDGVSGMEVLGALIDLDPAAPAGEAAVFEPRSAPSGAGMVARSLVHLAGRPGDAWTIATGLVRWLPGLVALTAAKPRNPLQRKTSQQSQAGDSLPVRTPVTSFNAKISRRRRVGVTDLPLADIKQVKTAFGTSVNDVVMAVVAGALRRWLLHDGGVLSQPLVAMVPVAVHSPDRSTQGNYVTAMLATLPTHLDDPLRRLKRSSKFSKAAKRSGGAVPPNVLVSAMEFAPPMILGAASRAVWDGGLFRAMRPFNLVISNVPGGTQDVYLAGARLERMYPVSVVVDGMGMNVTLLGHKDTLHLGITTCPELVPDPQQICDWAREELQLLLEASTA
ncbi:wax ester/triacylglycerol synthase family O-acyltransferase [Yimella sp. cx-573]|nr:wax ester/triacylglycerol synthase family O-acyltransferase [Yimella sp. cx-573]